MKQIGKFSDLLTHDLNARTIEATLREILEVGSKVGAEVEFCG